jgi:phosphate/sulfate permease
MPQGKGSVDSCCAVGAAAWVLTLPATILVSGGLFYLLS